MSNRLSSIFTSSYKKKLKIVSFVFFSLVISYILSRKKRITFVTPWTTYTTFRCTVFSYEHIVRKRNKRLLFHNDFRKNDSENIALLTSFGPLLDIILLHRQKISNQSNIQLHANNHMQSIHAFLNSSLWLSGKRWGEPNI